MAKKDFSFDRKEPVKKQVKDIDEFIEGEKNALVRKTIVIPEKYFTMVKAVQEWIRGKNHRVLKLHRDYVEE